MIWPFGCQHPPRAIRRIQKQAANQPWKTVEVPAFYDRGIADPLRAHTRYFPSPYTAPTGVRWAQTEEGWVVAWRYLESPESGRAVQVAPQVWAWVSPRPSRLLALAGQGQGSPTAWIQAAQVWLDGQPQESCSHAEVMSHLLRERMPPVSQVLMAGSRSPG